MSCFLPKKLDKFFDKKPVLAAKKCSERFPIIEKYDTVIVVDSSTIRQYEIEFGYLYSLLDSILGDTVSKMTKKEIVTVFQDRRVPVVKYKYITKTVESTARYKVLLDSCNEISKQYSKDIDAIKRENINCNNKYTKLEGEYADIRYSRNKLYWWILLLLVLLFRRPIVKSISKLIIKP